ncbi:hypothetical protein EDB85DRAFT_672387 [Lactarius pseudohatsudake]|nr:hypothetical protein EDB85DRAFT_672387 [Lactarius pseudohatsudake]
MQNQTRAFRKYRGDDGRVMKWLKQTVQILYALSTSTALGEGIGLPFPPAKAILAGLGIFLAVCTGSVHNCFYICDPQVIMDVSASSDAVLDLFELSENFLRCLDIYTKSPPTTTLVVFTML